LAYYDGDSAGWMLRLDPLGRACTEGDLSFSWYCRLELTATVAGAAAARTGEAIIGRALAATTRPACGTTAATLRNIV